MAILVTGVLWAGLVTYLLSRVSKRSVVVAAAEQAAPVSAVAVPLAEGVARDPASGVPQEDCREVLAYRVGLSFMAPFVFMANRQTGR